MKLETALQIIKQQYDYISKNGGYQLDDDDIGSLSYNGDVVSEWVVNYVPDSMDKSLVYVTEEEQYGGEGCGDSYYYVFKINHPEHGIGYIRYSGQYDSWNGTEWYDGNVEIVIPKQVMKTIYVTK